LRGARNLDYPFDMSRFLRSVRLALHPAQTINQRFLKGNGVGMFGFGKKHIIIASPMDGVVVPVSKVNDPVFNEDVLGRGIAIKPESCHVCAPGKATVTQMFETGHAVSLLMDNGVELLIHVGIDTVKLKGRHFNIHKNSGDTVDTGDVLMEFDAEGIKAEGYDTITPIVICNPDDFSDISFASEGPIIEGEPLITIGNLRNPRTLR